MLGGDAIFFQYWYWRDHCRLFALGTSTLRDDSSESLPADGNDVGLEEKRLGLLGASSRREVQDIAQREWRGRIINIGVV